MRQTEYRRRNTALVEEIFEDVQKVSQDELNWLFRQIRYKVRRLDGQRMKVTTASPRLQKSYVVSGNLWEFFVQRMRRAVTRAIVKGAIKLATLQRNHFFSFKPVEFDPEEFAKFIEPEIGERIVGVTKTIKRQVGAKVVGWYNSPGTTMQSLVDQLKPTFGEKRARLIAQTEVTRLNSEVKYLTAEQIGATEWWWSTRRDNLVCVKPLKGPDGKVYKGCRELHGKTFDIGLLMPPDGSHPGCRCDPVLVPPRRTATAQTRPVIEGLLKFDENQPRDEEGKWTDTGKGGGSTSGYKVRDGGFEFRGYDYTGTPEEFREKYKNEHLYHATNKSNLDAIKKEGLVSGKPTNFEGYKTPAVALSTTTATADYFTSLMEASYKDKGREFEPVLLRVKVSDTDAKPYKWHPDEVRSGNIPPEKLEMWDEDKGEWKALVGRKASKTEKPKEVQEALDNYLSPKAGSPEERAFDSVMDRIYDARRDYHNENTPENLDYLIGSCRSSRSNKERIAALVTMQELPFNEDGTVTLYRGGNLGGQSWSTDKEWATRFAVYGFGAGGEKRKGGTKLYRKDFTVDQLVVALPWEGEVIVNKDSATDAEEIPIEYPITKADFVESEHPRDEEGKFTDKGTGVSGGSAEPAYKQTDRYKEFTAAIGRYHNSTDEDERYQALRDAEDAADSYRMNSNSISKEMREDYFDGNIPLFVTGYIKKGAEGAGYYGNVIFYTDFNKAKASLQSGETLTAFDVEARAVIPVDKQDKTCMSDGMYFRDNRDVDLNYEPPKELPVKYKLVNTKYNNDVNEIFNIVKIPKAVKKYNDNHPGTEITPTEYVEQCEKRLKEVIDDTDVCVRLPVANLNKVLEQGSYKSVFEAEKSQAGGYAGGADKKERYLKHRQAAENDMFGIPEAQVTDRPVYGYLAGKGSVHPNSEDLEQYGSVALVLKDSVRERTTFTHGDSLDDVNLRGVMSFLIPDGRKLWGGRGEPSKLTDPKVQSLTFLENTFGKDWLTNMEEDDANPSNEGGITPQKEAKYGYWEAQVSSGFSVDEIASVAFIGKEPGSKTTKALDKLGIPWKVVEGYVEKMLKADQPNGVLIARNDYLALYALDGETGYVVNIETGKRYPTHMLASILSRGYWEMVEDEDLTKFDPNQPRDEDGKWTDGGSVNHEKIEAVSRRNSPFETFRLSNNKPKIIEDIASGVAEGLGIKVGIKILGDKEFNEKFKNAKISPEAAMMGGSSTITAGYHSLENTIYLRQSGIDKITNWKEFADYRFALYHEMGHAYHVNAYGITQQDKGEYGSGWAEQFADGFAGALGFAEEMWRLKDKPGNFPKLNERAKSFDFKSYFNGFLDSNKPVRKFINLTKWEEQKHPRRKDGKFAPKGQDEAGGVGKTGAERPANEKSRSNPDIGSEIGNDVEGRPQMGRNFDFSAERDMFGNGKGYTQEQYMRFKKRELTVKYAETEPFNNEMTQKEYIDKYIRRGWRPTNENEPYQLVNPEGTRKRTVSRQGMKDYLDVVLNRGEYKANYDLPEGADVVPAVRAVPERVAKPKPEPVSYPDGASVAKVLAEYAGEYDENSEEVKKRKTFLETAKLELEKYGDDELRDENNKEAQRALEQYTRAMTYLKIEIDTQKAKDRYEKGLELTRVTDGVKMNPRLAPEFKGKKINQVNNGVRTFENIVSAQTGLRVTDVRFELRPKGRSSYNHDNLRVTLSKQEMILTDAIVHELGHHLEFEAPGVRIAAQKFFQKRTDGEKLEHMNKYNRGYRPDEVCKPDKFIDPYVGKVYPDGSTEIISVGLAAYFSDPLQFAKDDPEHFALIYDAVHGKFSNNL